MDHYLYHYRAVMRRAYDGDTIYVDIDLGFGNWLKSQALRLYGINTPEVRGPERPEGLIAKAEVIRLMPPGTEFTLRTHKDSKGKYGRWLADIYLNDMPQSLNKYLVENGFAVEVDY